MLTHFGKLLCSLSLYSKVSIEDSRSLALHLLYSENVLHSSKHKVFCHWRTHRLPWTLWKQFKMFSELRRCRVSDPRWSVYSSPKMYSLFSMLGIYCTVCAEVSFLKHSSSHTWQTPTVISPTLFLQCKFSQILFLCHSALKKNSTKYYLTLKWQHNTILRKSNNSVYISI